MLRSKFKLGVSFNTGADQNTVKINDTVALKSYQPRPTSSWWPFLPIAGGMEGDGAVCQLLMQVSQVLSLKIRVLNTKHVVILCASTLYRRSAYHAENTQIIQEAY